MSQLLLHILVSYTVFQGLSLLLLFPLSTMIEHLYCDMIRNEGYKREEENQTLKEEIKENIKLYLSLFLKPGIPLEIDLFFIFAPNYVFKKMKEEELKQGIIKKIENESTNIKEANKSLEENISIAKDNKRDNTGLTEEQMRQFDEEWDKEEFLSGRVENNTGYSYSKKRKPNKK